MNTSLSELDQSQIITQQSTKLTLTMITHFIFENEHEIDRDLLFPKWGINTLAPYLKSFIVTVNTESFSFFPPFSHQLNAAFMDAVLVPSFSSAFKSVKHLYTV